MHRLMAKDSKIIANFNVFVNIIIKTDCLFNLFATDLAELKLFKYLF